MADSSYTQELGKLEKIFGTQRGGAYNMMGQMMTGMAHMTGNPETICNSDPDTPEMDKFYKLFAPIAVLWLGIILARFTGQDSDKPSQTQVVCYSCTGVILFFTLLFTMFVNKCRNGVMPNFLGEGTYLKYGFVFFGLCASGTLLWFSMKNVQDMAYGENDKKQHWMVSAVDFMTAILNMVFFFIFTAPGWLPSILKDNRNKG